MSDYNAVASYGGVYFNLGDVQESRQVSTLKTTMGATFVEVMVPLRNTTDKVLKITGVINGLGRTAGQSFSDAVEGDRAALVLLEDGEAHSYDDGRNSGDYAIRPGSLIINDPANRSHGEPVRFTMELVEWS